MCAPDQSLNTVGAFAVTPLRPSLHPQQPPAPHNRVLAHMWQVVQNNNGIKVRLRGECHGLTQQNGRVRSSFSSNDVVLQVLLSLLSVKMPITDADLIRALACKALVGLSRSSAIRQIISKLPLFTSSHIQQVSAGSELSQTSCGLWGNCSKGKRTSDDLFRDASSAALSRSAAVNQTEIS